jgi:hypothetical protein
MSLESEERAAGVRAEFRPFLAALRADQGRWAVGVDGGVRYDADIARLWAKGRTTKGEPPYTAEQPLGQVVTNVEHPEDGPHYVAYRAALDIWALDPAIPRPTLLPNGHPEWARLRALGMSYGLNVVSWDGPHFELFDFRNLEPEVADEATAGQASSVSTTARILCVALIGGLVLWLRLR